MPMPNDIGIIDLMLGIPISTDNSEYYEFIKPLLMDEQSRQMFKMPVQYMFKDIPQTEADEDKIAWTVEQMDKFGIEKAMIGIGASQGARLDAVDRYPDRFMLSYECNPSRGMEEVRKIRQMKRDHNIVAVTAFPAGMNPQVPINDKKFYPIYTACVEEDLPFFCTTGIAGPRIPSMCQRTELIEEVVWFFPELKFVMRHGAEPWEELAVKLMLKFPNLYYSTSAFAPKHYPQAIVDYANSRGSDKILYAGYFPMGLSLDRIFSDMEKVPFKDEVWPKFLRGNAMKLFGMEDG
ncbi:MAG: amidohydrolase family protein [Sphingomonadaceae bacterium]|nr:amidohydrolase family protein [Sphingomonadaceae bacterium]